MSDADARRRIREDFSCGFLVEAAAGTGKTQCFVERIVSGLRQGRFVAGQVAAVTFTRKAAGELRLRVRTELSRALGSADGEEKSRLRSALLHLSEAHIGTIHGFCAEILRRHPVEAGIDPAFREIDEEEAQQLLGRAFDRWFEGRLADPPPGLKRVLARTEVDDRPVRERLMQAVTDLAEVRDLDAPWALVDASLLEEARVLAADVAALAPDVAAGRPRQAYKLGFMRAELLVEVAERWARSDGHEALSEDELEADLVWLAGRLRPARDLRGTWSEDLSGPKLEASYNTLLARLGAFRDRANTRLAPLLQRELRDVVEAYRCLQHASGTVDHLDLLLHTRRLLVEHPDVRRTEAARFAFIGIDELQDTDPVQTELMLLLSQREFEGSSWRDVRPDPGRLFLVGDPKQAIYGFRRATMELYLALRTHLLARGLERLELRRSFRARGPIQRLVNRVFEPVFGAPDEPQPSQPGYVPLEGGDEDRPELPSIAVLAAPQPWGKQGRVTLQAHGDSSARSIVGFVDWLLHRSGFQVRSRPGPRSSDGWRPVEAKDVAVLFRSVRSFSTWGPDPAKIVADGLQEHGIRSSLLGRTRLADRDEVEAVRTALHALEWPSEPLWVYGVLTGPLFALTPFEVHRYLRRHGHLMPYRAGEPAEDRDDQPAGERDALDELRSVEEALLVLEKLSRERNARPVAETVVELLLITGAMTGFAHEPAGTEVVANVERVIALARSFEQRSPGGIRGFLELLDRARESSSVQRAQAEHGEGVQISNAHRIKGLEAPVVILADARKSRWSRADRFIDVARKMAAIELVGCRPRELDHVEPQLNLQSLAEEDRLAYVAATRARDLLVVTGSGTGWSDLGIDQSWFGPFHTAIYPDPQTVPTTTDAWGSDPAAPSTVDDPPAGSRFHRPIVAGAYGLDAQTPYVWISCAHARVQPQPLRGLEREDALNPQGAEADVSFERRTAWRKKLATSQVNGRQPQERLVRASNTFESPPDTTVRVRRESVPRAPGRPTGARFGQLVHDLLSTRPWDLALDSLSEHARLLGRPLRATPEEAVAAGEAVRRLLESPWGSEIAGATEVATEMPIVFRTDVGEVMDGVIDLLYRFQDRWTVVEYKTGRITEESDERAVHQVQWYVEAVRKVVDRPVRGVVLRI